MSSFQKSMQFLNGSFHSGFNCFAYFFNFSLFSLNRKIWKIPALPLPPMIKEEGRKGKKRNHSWKWTSNQKELDSLCFSGLAIAFFYDLMKLLLMFVSKNGVSALTNSCMFSYILLYPGVIIKRILKYKHSKLGDIKKLNIVNLMLVQLPCIYALWKCILW